MKNLFLFLIFFFLVSNVEANQTRVLSGRVVFGTEGVADAIVKIRELDEDMEHYVETNEDGYFSINLKEGVYFIEGRKNLNQKSYVGFSGRNPLLLNEDTYVGIKLLPESRISKKTYLKRKNILKIRCFKDGKPVDSVRIYLYLKVKDIKGMPYLFTEPTKKNSIVIKDLLEGSYYIVARKKRDNNPLGPLSEGDLIGFFSKNPLTIKDGFSYEITIHMFEKIKDIVTKPVETKKYFKIQGKVVNEKGEPVSNVYAFLYTKKEMGHERPLSISNRTKEDGFFELIAPTAGRYYLGVRQFYGGTPVQGELYGLYDKTYDHHIDVFENITGIVIKTKKILR